MICFIDPITTEEIPSFWKVFKEVLQTQFPGYTKETIDTFLNKLYTEWSYRYYIENNLKTVFVARVEGQIVGFAVIDEPYGGVSLLRWLGIKKEYQKMGIGKLLIEKWFELAQKQNCHKVEVAAQPEAKEFYAKMGLNLEGKRVRSYFGIDQYIFGKVIVDTSRMN